MMYDGHQPINRVGVSPQQRLDQDKRPGDGKNVRRDERPPAGALGEEDQGKGRPNPQQGNGPDQVVHPDKLPDQVHRAKQDQPQPDDPAKVQALIVCCLPFKLVNW